MRGSVFTYLFVFFAALIVRNEFWVAGGLGRAADHILVTGSLTALAALPAALLGYRSGLGCRTFAETRPQWVYSAALAASALLWTYGIVSGL